MTSVRVERRAARAAVVAVAVLLAGLAGCARAVDGAGTTAGADAGASAGLATRASGPDAPDGAAPDGADPDGADPVGADPVGRLRAGLLGPADLGVAWRRSEPPVPDPSTPAPCGGPGTVARFPDALRVGSTVAGPAGALVQEALSVYGDADTAQAAFRAGVAGLDCGTGTLHGAAVEIEPVDDLARDVAGDRSAGWRVRSDELDAVLVLVQARQAVFAFAYVMPTEPSSGAVPSDAGPFGAASVVRPDPRELTRTAVARALAA